MNGYAARLVICCFTVISLVGGLVNGPCMAAIRYANGGTGLDATGVGLASGFGLALIFMYMGVIGSVVFLTASPAALQRFENEADRPPPGQYEGRSFLVLQGPGVMIAGAFGPLIGVRAWFVGGTATVSYALWPSMIAGGLAGLVIGLFLAVCLHYLIPFFRRRSPSPAGTPS